MSKKQHVTGVIPARYDSSRFRGKVLTEIAGKPMIQWVYEQPMLQVELVVSIQQTVKNKERKKKEAASYYYLGSPISPRSE
jgi:CMP-2-keto-3-deoxyoctulosonic acid synthetase